ncbi:MAG: transposase family protein [Planctomycetota bacterium]|jgi:IS5 family transposase
MIGKTDKTPQLNMYQVPLLQFINKDHELYILAERINWDELEQDLSEYYCVDNGRPSIPIRKIVGVILLNKFRQRMSEKGMERILKISIDLFERKEIQEKQVLVDTTVQEKNITYPTDTKLQKKIIENCRDIAKDEGIVLRQSYKRILKQLMIDQRFREHPKRRKKANAAARKIKVIAGRVVRDLERKFNDEQLGRYEQDFLLFNLILGQKQKDSNKIYSLHEPDVRCIAKGKEAKKYEFGNKVSIVKTMKSGIIIGALSFSDNPYDTDTLDPQLRQVERLTGRFPETAITPAYATNYQKQKARKYFRARAGIEPVIGHIKHDHRMIRNYLSGTQGDAINTLLAATGFNLMKMLRRIKAESINFCLKLLEALENNIKTKTPTWKNQWVFQV